MRTPTTLLAALAALALSACHRPQEPTTPEPERFGNMTTKDARGAAKTMKTTEQVAGEHTMNVIVDSVTPGTNAASLGKAEDSAHGNLDTLLAGACRRIDTAASSAGASGDYATFDCDAEGRVYVRTKPSSVTNTTYIASGSSAGDITGTTIATSDYTLACFQVVMTNGSTPVGSFSVQGSIDGTNWDAIYLPAARVYGENFTDATTPYPGGFSVGISSPAGTVGLSVCVDNAFPNIRLVYTRSSGGAAATVTGFSFLRAN